MGFLIGLIVAFLLGYTFCEGLHQREEYGRAKERFEAQRLNNVLLRRK